MAMPEHGPGSSSDRDPERMEREAVGWFTRMNGKPSPVERRDFRNWLREHEHREAYERIATIWSAVGALRPDDPAERAALVQALNRVREHRRRTRAARILSATAGCLLAVLCGGWLWLEQPHLIQDLQADMVSARAERREFTLTDGSRVLLDADSALRISLADDRRDIRLLRGTAYFEVRPAPTPFTVEAEDGRATVLGTRFMVSMRDGGRVAVILEEGRLSVALGSSRQGNGDAEVLLHSGERVDYGPDGLEKVRPADPDALPAWRRGRLSFTDARLGDVIAEIGRYRDGRIIVLGKALADRRVSGNIALENPDKALAALRSSVDFRVTTLGSRLVVIHP
ncbi:Fe2+-dicitrate sensor, membrane component (plasmid) [Azospirillum humicireducens]|uniref:Fe2+-dicitrate sensor, membrane component n=2 Tax=Azospirillum humicireducens TaxID=1226968 RepID=A0A2R4VS11_9PROT|nr:Fe2+-dicitrate sensor, membrane component [Azospirillum humicireducens]